jgi:hypothetical protein
MTYTGLLPWHKTLAEKLRDYDPRTIHALIHCEENQAKIPFIKYMCTHENAQVIPSTMKSQDKILQFVMGIPIAKTYIINTPKFKKRKHLHAFYRGIETLKRGMLYKKGRRAKFTYIDEPNIIVFTSKRPNLNHINGNRWLMWQIQQNQLEYYQHPNTNP